MAAPPSVSWLVLTALFAVAAGLKGCSNLEVDSGEIGVGVGDGDGGVVGVGVADGDVVITEWNTGMSADLIVTSDHAGHGWSLELTWDQPLDTLDQWSGTASSSDKQ